MRSGGWGPVTSCWRVASEPERTSAPSCWHSGLESPSPHKPPPAGTRRGRIRPASQFKLHAARRKGVSWHRSMQGQLLLVPKRGHITKDSVKWEYLFNAKQFRSQMYVCAFTGPRWLFFPMSDLFVYRPQNCTHILNDKLHKLGYFLNSISQSRGGGPTPLISFTFCLQLLKWGL